MQNKKRMKHITTGVLAVTLAIGGTSLTSLAEAVPVSGVPLMPGANGGAVEAPVKYAHYGAFTGIVESVQPHHSMPGATMIRVAGEGGAIADFVISPSTVLAEQARLEPGSRITGWYDARKPVILIYPPQYTVELVTPAEDGVTWKADYFDDALISADGALKLNLQEEASMMLWERFGQPYEESLSGKHLLVKYRASTRSIPAQTTPEAVFVIEEGAWLTTAGDLPVVVNGRVAHGPSALIMEDQTIMVPLRAAAEALGLEVIWLSESQTVVVGKASLTIGQNAYAFDKMAPRALKSAPVLIKGRTFVPLAFFGEVLPELKSKMTDGKIEILVNSAS